MSGRELFSLLRVYANSGWVVKTFLCALCPNG